MPAVPSVEPLEYRKRGKRNCPSLGKIIFKISLKEKKSSDHHGNGHDKHSLRHKFVYQILFRPLKVAAQQSFFFRLHGERHIKKTIGNKVEPNDLRRQKRERITQEKRACDGQRFSQAGGEEIEDYFFNCFVNTSPFFYCRNNASKVV